MKSAGDFASSLGHYYAACAGRDLASGQPQEDLAHLAQLPGAGTWRDCAV